MRLAAPLTIVRRLVVALIAWYAFLSWLHIVSVEWSGLMQVRLVERA